MQDGRVCKHVNQTRVMFGRHLHVPPPLPLVTCAPLQCQCGQVPADPLRVRELLRLGEELPAHAGGGGLQPGDVRLPVRQAELQPHVPQLAALGWVSCHDEMNMWLS